MKSNISQKLKKWLITEGRPKPVGQKYKLRFLLKIAIFVKNWNFGQKLNFLLKIELFVKKWTFCYKLNFLLKIALFVENWTFCKKWNFC